MKAIMLRQPAGLEHLERVTLADPGAPAAGEIRVRIHASSLNYHDLGVVTGRLNPADKRIPMSDGAGVVEAIGEGVTEFAPGDAVVSTFSVLARRRADRRGLRDGPGRRCRRLRARVGRAPRALVHACAAGLHARASRDADDGGPHRMARARRRRRPEGGRQRARARHGRRIDLRAAVREANGRDRDRHVVVGRKAGTRTRARRRSRRQLSSRRELERRRCSR